ncbi:forkhead box protein N3 isoform X2 [Callorhinchus milii]|uniref:forkhead box protein N3 isoform X2 n=1 Tax=Callorhinchus milii TaxID=7868 RepID=UPI00045740C4|nr:forkhead box protein N3 isoform X2 [Callorhinchus milii]|eukprot:gi/632975362/ref/XP_007904189.1/ PREDICTED: forkhead box protein N3 isoform X2 [Callorhinchus milii]
MGPVMPPSKKPEGSGISVSSGLSQCYPGNTLTKELQEAEEMDLTSSCLPAGRADKANVEDEELTNLNWLHESKNLLKSFGDTVLRSVSPVQDVDEDTPPSPAHSDQPYDAKQNPNCKPPYSFSCLIFMAIEDSPSKRLPVKDIYNWILEHFPYFANAPTGWKNSVRHNLSLNKCFKKVDKDRSQSIGKGSLWCIDPEYRQNLIQALKKTPYHPYSHVFNTPPTSPRTYQSTSSPPLWPASAFFKRNGALQDPVGVIPNGGRAFSRGPFIGIKPLPINSIGSMAAAVREALGTSLRQPGRDWEHSIWGIASNVYSQWNGIANCRMRTDSEQSCGSPVVSSDPKEDHNYSVAKSSNHRSSSPNSDSTSSSSSSSSADDHYEFAAKGSHEGSEGSYHSHESYSEAEEEEKKHSRKESKDSLADSGYLSQHKKRQQQLTKTKKTPSDTLPLKKRRTEKPPESDDEEMKEAAGSLLHLAGIRSCLDNITNRTSKGQKEQQHSAKN